MTPKHAQTGRNIFLWVETYPLPRMAKQTRGDIQTNQEVFFFTQRHQRNSPKGLIFNAEMNHSTVLVDLLRPQRYCANASQDISAVVCVKPGCCHGHKSHINLAFLLKVSRSKRGAWLKASFLWSTATTGFPWDNDHSRKTSRAGTAKGNIPVLLFKIGQDTNIYFPMLKMTTDPMWPLWERGGTWLFTSPTAEPIFTAAGMKTCCSCAIIPSHFLRSYQFNGVAIHLHETQYKASNGAHTWTQPQHKQGWEGNLFSTSRSMQPFKKADIFSKDSAHNDLTFTQEADYHRVAWNTGWSF